MPIFARRAGMTAVVAYINRLCWQWWRWVGRLLSVETLQLEFPLFSLDCVYVEVSNFDFGSIDLHCKVSRCFVYDLKPTVVGPVASWVGGRRGESREPGEVVENKLYPRDVLVVCCSIVVEDVVEVANRT